MNILQEESIFFKELIKMVSTAGSIRFKPTYGMKGFLSVENHDLVKPSYDPDRKMIYCGDYPGTANGGKLIITSTWNLNINVCVGLSCGRWYCYLFDNNCKKMPVFTFPTMRAYSDQQMTSSIEPIRKFLRKSDELALEAIYSVIPKMIIFRIIANKNEICRSVIFLIANMIVTLVETENFGIRFRIPC